MQYNPEEFQELLNIFKAESEEIIQSLNDGFLELEKNPEDKTVIKKLLQNAHSIKGASRMLGFNAIQDISHKLEDMLTFWKEEDVVIDADSFATMYEICDFLYDIVANSVDKQSDYFDIRVVQFLNRLDGFMNNKNIKAFTTNEEYSQHAISSQNTDINAIILELLFVLERDGETDNLEENLMIISDNLNSLFEIFKKTDFDDIKDRIYAIQNKLTSTEDIRALLNNLKEDISELKNEIYKELNVSLSAVKNNENDVIELNSDEPCKEASEDIFDYLLKNMAKIKQDKNFVDEIKPHIQILEQNTWNENAKQIVSKIINILELLKQGHNSIDNDCYMTILQGVYLVKKISHDAKEANSPNINSFLRRLNVINDMLSPNNLKNPDAENYVSKEEAALPNLNSDINKIRKNFNSIEINEIRTLRVDTAKIDNLISQTGELLINGIKTKEHRDDLSEINIKLSQWHSSCKKIMNYIKYLEKRGFFSPENDDSVSLFYKKIHGFLLNNADMITQIRNDFDKLYSNILENDNKLHQSAWEIKSIAKGIRILPLATIFHSFPRMIRDIANENNKKIDFIVTGSDTTVDKKLIEEIKMPLVHILRNAVSHGIEEPEERINNGKPETGTIKLTAKHEDKNILIIIEDDGYGINLEKVKKQAIKNGILLPEEVDNMSNEQLMKLLFLPGFSTRDSINEISGRGIGLDIVKTKINNLNGDIQIDSVLNKGCRVTIKLPLVMSTLKAFIMNVNEQKYAIPINSVKFVKKINKNDIFQRGGQNFIIYNEHSIPIYLLSEILDEKSASVKNEELTVIIIENQNQKAAFIIDSLIGSQDILHKKLVAPIIKIKNISGFTKLSTGEICLIINHYELIQNTLMSDRKYYFNPSAPISKKDDARLKQTKILVYDDGNIDYIKSDLLNEFDNVVFYASVNSLYDYVQNNEVGVFICRLSNSDKELLNFMQYIKNDEILSKIKTVIFSDLTSFDILSLLNHFRPDLYLKNTEYDKSFFIDILKQKLL